MFEPVGQLWNLCDCGLTKEVAVWDWALMVLSVSGCSSLLPGLPRCEELPVHASATREGAAQLPRLWDVNRWGPLKPAARASLLP